jgi:virginiamycin B lyase
MNMRLSVTPSLALLLTALSTSVSAAPVQIDEWIVPWEASRPRDPYVASDGRVWFNGQADHYIAVLDPASGDMRRVDLPDDAGPHNLIIDQDGIVWYAGNRRGYIGRYDDRDGSFTRYPMPDAAARDPHTLVFGPEGDIWFTLQQSNMLGRLDPVSGAVQLQEATTPRARPYGIVAVADGVWVALFGSNRLAHWTTDGHYTEFELPDPALRPRRLEVIGDDVWYVDYATGRLGVLRTDDGSQQTWPLPAGRAAQPYAMAVDHRGRIWLVETGPAPIRLIGVDPSDMSFFSVTDVPSGAGSIRHMVFDAERQEIWFGTDANTVGRAHIPD